ncbi:MAG: DUF4145 domain-containing protein [Actinomycetota bacterium]|nr:DUF4145 domain-containing protein [Actinomycetota bacterium]
MASTDCGYCGRLVHMRPLTAWRRVPGEFARAINEAAYACPNCYRVNVAYEYDDASVEAVLADDIADTYRWGPHVQWLPKIGERIPFPDVPSHIADAATEATFCLSMDAHRAAGALARAVIEATCKDKGANGKDLSQRIEALANAEHVRTHTKEQAHEVRHFGNDMAHGDFAEPVGKAEAQEVIGLMVEILDEVYQSPARLARRRAARQQAD